MAVSIEPFPAPFVLSLINKPALNTAIAAIAADPALTGLCAGVVDLSGPSYAGFNDDDMLYVGSLQKICAMYVAFELRSRVRQQVAAAIADGLSTSKTGWHLAVIKDLESAWQPKLTAAFPKPLPAGFPKLNDIFTFTNTGDVNFSSNGESQADLDHRETKNGTDGIAHGDISGLKFFELLKQMLRWSNNQAAGRCVLALSYPYINGVLKGAGFFDRASAGPPATPARGLWMSGSYTGSDWLAKDAAGIALSPRWAKAQDRRVTNFAGTARQVACLMMLLAQDKLVTDPSNPDVNKEIRDVLSGTHGIGSYLASALRSGGRPFDEVFSKIGWGNDTRRHDCGIVERTVAGTKVRYAVAGLGGDNNLVSLSKLFVEIDKAI